MTGISSSTSMQKIEEVRAPIFNERLKKPVVVEVGAGQSIHDACGGNEVVEHLVLWGLPTEECDENWSRKTEKMANWEILDRIPPTVEKITCRFGRITPRVLNELARVTQTRHIECVDCVWENPLPRFAETFFAVSEVPRYFRGSGRIREITLSGCDSIPPDFFRQLPRGLEVLTFLEGNLWKCTLHAQQLGEICPALTRLNLGFQDFELLPNSPILDGAEDEILHLLDAMPDDLTELNIHCDALSGKMRRILIRVPELQVLRLANPKAMLTEDDQRYLLRRHFLRHPELRIELPQSARGDVLPDFAYDKHVRWV